MFRVNWRATIKQILVVDNMLSSCCACGRPLSSISNNSVTVSLKLTRANLTSSKYQKDYRFHFMSYYATKASSKKAPKVIKVKDVVTPPEESLTPEETAKVLQVVNEVQQAEDLLKYIIPKKKAEEVIRRKNDSDDKQIGSLEDLISIVGPKNSAKFFCSILNKPIPVNAAAAMFPVLNEQEISRISKVLSIVIVGDKISWCLVQRLANENVELSVETFQQVSYPFKPRMHFLTLLKEMEVVVDQLPDAELYIVEEYPATVPTPYMFTFQLQMAQARSMVLGLLATRNEASMIISVKTVAVARLFNTYIGFEKVSGQYLVEDMLINEKNPCLKVADLMIQDYKTADPKVKEGLSQAILLNFAYWKMTQQIRIT